MQNQNVSTAVVLAENRPSPRSFTVADGADLLIGLGCLLLPLLVLRGIARGRLPRTGLIAAAVVLFLGLSADELLDVGIRLGAWGQAAVFFKTVAAFAVLLTTIWLWARRGDFRDLLRDEEKSTRRANEAGEDRFQLLANSLQKFVWIAGPNGQVYFYNDYCLSFSGQPRGTPYLDLWRSIVHPDDRLRVEEAWWKAVHAALPYENETRLRCPRTGEYRWFQTRALPVLGKNGEIYRWYGSTADVHDQRTASQQIAAEREKLASVLENSPNLVALFRGPERRCELASPSFSELVGSSSTEGLTLHELLRDPALSPLLQFIEQVFSSGAPLQRSNLPIVVQSRQRRKCHFNLSVQPVVEAGGNTEGVVVYLWEVSAEVEARLRLIASEERFRKIFSSNLIGMFFWNAQGQVVDANDAFLALTGYSREEIATGSLYLEQLTPPEYTGVGFPDIADPSAAGPNQPIEKEMYRKDGSRFPTLFGSTWVDHQSGEAVSFVLDLTHQRHAEMERTLLKARAESAREASELKSRFLANMSHEIRTPLHAVLGFARLLRESELKAEQASYAESIESSGENLLRLINDILDLSKIEARRLSFQAGRLRMESLIERAIETVRVASGRDLPVLFHQNGSTPVVLGDELRIGQLLTNIIGNAVKFTPQGVVDVSLSWKPITDGRAELVVSVEDTGIGISPTTLQRLFQPFEQADGTHARHYSGTGLGLSISRNLAQMMDGDVILESVEGEGSVATITLRLPIASAGVTPRTPSSPQVARSLSYPGARVLVGEDNPLNQTIVKKLLENLGCEVDIAVDGTETLRRLETSLYDLLLLDCQMPDLDGYEVVRRLRRREQGTRRHLPVVAMTADAMAGAEARCLESGMDAYLSKPLDFSLFERALERYLGEFRREPQPSAGSTGAVNLGALDLLAQADTRGTLVSQILGIFFETTPERLEKLEESARDGDETTALRTLHTLKGSFGTVGLMALADACAELEADRLAKKETDLLARVREIRSAYVSAEAELREAMKGYASARRPIDGAPATASSSPAT